MAPHVESERKYLLSGDQQLPSLGEVASEGEASEFVMVATYYDAVDFRLIRSWQVLRRRTGGTDEGWHLKLPGQDADHRVEVHAPLDGPRVPAELRAQVSATLKSAALFPVATLRTLRHQVPLLDESGAVQALVCVDRVSATVDGRTTTWREAEVELADGPATLLDAVEERFRAAGVFRAPVGSKVARALDAAMTAAAERVVTPQNSGGDVVRDYLAVQVGVLQSREQAVRADEPDAVHRSRVATRRLRSALRTFSGIFDRSVTDPLRAELRWHAEELGAPRDAEVLKERLLASLESVPQELVAPEVRDRIASSLDAAHLKAHAELVATMDSPRYEHLQVALERLLADPPVSPAADQPAIEVLPRMLDAAVARVRRLTRHAEAKPADLTRWHEVRKAAKAARYCSEALAGAFGEPAKSLVTAWEQVTEAFGEVQDTVVAQQVIGDLAWEAEQAGLPRTAFDELAHDQEQLRREALLRGIEALADAVQRAMSTNLAEVTDARSSGDSST